MVPATHNLTISRDRDFTQVFILKDASGVVINLSGYAARAQIRPAKDSSDLIAAFTVVIVAASGKITISLTDVQALALDESKVWGSGDYQSIWHEGELCGRFGGHQGDGE